MTQFAGTLFDGAIDVRKAGGFDCTRIAQTSRVAPRTPHEVADPGLCYIILQLGGRSRLSQIGREATLEPGDITVIDSGAPCEFTFERRVLQLSLHVPRVLIEDRAPQWRSRLARPFGAGAAALVGALLVSAFEQLGPSGPEQDLATREALLALIGSALREGSTSTSAPTSRLPAAVRDIQNYLLAHLRDPVLTPKALAQRHALSERQLHRLFQSSGICLRQWIRQSRLDRCAADLRNPALLKRSVSEIAFGWGFNDAAHFSRIFRAEFDESPREYRAVIARRQRHCDEQAAATS